MRMTSVAGTAILSGLLLAGLTACSGGSGSAATSAGPAASPAGGSGSAAGTASAAATGGQDWTGLNSSLDPCALLTTAEVAAAVNMKVDSGKVESSEPPGTRGCNWTTAAGDSGAGAAEIASVTAEVTGPQPVLKARFPTARSYYNFLRQLYSKSATDVPGIGDSAFLTQKDTWIFALKGHVLLRVFATFGTASTDRAVIEKLMKEALART